MEIQCGAYTAWRYNLGYVGKMVLCRVWCSLAVYPWCTLHILGGAYTL